jgi:hypothetical protein
VYSILWDLNFNAEGLTVRKFNDRRLKTFFGFGFISLEEREKRANAEKKKKKIQKRTRIFHKCDLFIFCTYSKNYAFFLSCIWGLMN